eukprot:m.61308 g.61308  ORF g.61308 m.61308 type:complete len:92 (-) comp15759_c0_seq4:1320-1595(-)
MRHMMTIYTCVSDAFCGAFKHDRELTFRFSDAASGVPSSRLCTHASGWQRVTSLRAASGDNESFDAALVQELSLNTSDPFPDVSTDGQIAI